MRENSVPQTRERTISCLHALLRDGVGLEYFSLEAVSSSAGITRATIYRCFGSRRLLLEALLDQISDQAGYDRISYARSQADPIRALMDIAIVICNSWNTDTTTLVRLHAVGNFKVEFEESLIERHEQRSSILEKLVKRIRGSEIEEIKASVVAVDTLCRYELRILFYLGGPPK